MLLAFRHLLLCYTELKKMCQSPSAPSPVEIRFLTKIFLFQACFPTRKQVLRFQENDKHRHRKSWKTIYVKSCFLQCVHNGNLNLRTTGVVLSSQKSLKKGPGNKLQKKLKCQESVPKKISKLRSQNHHHIESNPVNYNHNSILLPPWSSKVVPRCQNNSPGCSRGAKMVPEMKASLPANGNCEELRGRRQRAQPSR